MREILSDKIKYIVHSACSKLNLPGQTVLYLSVLLSVLVWCQTKNKPYVSQAFHFWKREGLLKSPTLLRKLRFFIFPIRKLKNGFRNTAHSSNCNILSVKTKWHHIYRQKNNEPLSTLSSRHKCSFFLLLKTTIIMSRWTWNPLVETIA